MAYIIKIVHRFYNKTVKYGYYSITDTFTEKKAYARAFTSRIQARNHAEIYKHVFVEDDVYIMNEENDIGTYFSTHKKKATPKGILVNTMCIILLPILLPIVGIIMVKEYIMKLIGKEYR